MTKSGWENPGVLFNVQNYWIGQKVNEGCLSKVIPLKHVLINPVLMFIYLKLPYV